MKMLWIRLLAKLKLIPVHIGIDKADGFITKVKLAKFRDAWYVLETSFTKEIRIGWKCYYHVENFRKDLFEGVMENEYRKV